MAALAGVTGQPVKALGAEIGASVQVAARGGLLVLAVVFVVVGIKAADWSRPSRATYVQQVEAACETSGNSAAAARAIRELETPAGDNADIRAMLSVMDRLNAQWGNDQSAKAEGRSADAARWYAAAQKSVGEFDAAARAAGVSCLSLGR